MKPERIPGTNDIRLADGRIVDRGALMVTPLEPRFHPRFEYVFGFGRWKVEFSSPVDPRCGDHFGDSLQDETMPGLLRRLADAIEAGTAHFPVPDLP